MSLSDLASIGSFVSGIAVLISLVYLALQVRQAEKNQQSLMQQSRSDRASDRYLRTADPLIAATYLKGLAGENLTEIELFQFNNIFRSQMVGRQDTFLQHRQGFALASDLDSLRRRNQDLMSYPGARAMWLNVRHIYSPGFQTFIDEVVQGAPGSRAGDDPELWKAALAKVRGASD
ncbi:MAG TPA: hypothetical protein VN814_16255 [Caulobacteraceae bacterium]|nr:hypothetical protein [Caulobacteraceae bacterium]